MPTELPPLNAPSALQKTMTPAAFYRWRPMRVVLADDEQQTIFIPYGVAFFPITIIVSENSSVTLKSTATDIDVVNGDVAGTVLWFTETLAAKKLVLSSPMTALYFDNQSGGQLLVDIL